MFLIKKYDRLLHNELYCSFILNSLFFQKKIKLSILNYNIKLMCDLNMNLLSSVMNETIPLYSHNLKAGFAGGLFNGTGMLSKVGMGFNGVVNTVGRSPQRCCGNKKE